jgi:hypothetical protein
VWHGEDSCGAGERIWGQRKIWMQGRIHSCWMKQERLEICFRILMNLQNPFEAKEIPKLPWRIRPSSNLLLGSEKQKLQNNTAKTRHAASSITAQCLPWSTPTQHMTHPASGHPPG